MRPAMRARVAASRAPATGSPEVRVAFATVSARCIATRSAGLACGRAASSAALAGARAPSQTAVRWASIASGSHAAAGRASDVAAAAARAASGRCGVSCPCLPPQRGGAREGVGRCRLDIQRDMRGRGTCGEQAKRQGGASG